MKNLKYYLAAAFLSPASYGFAQTAADALRFSQTSPAGTARSLGIGGATSAVGADFGGLVTNPAGLGLFQRSEISFSPGLGISNTTSQAFGTSTTDSRNNLQVSSLGVVFSARRPDSDQADWRGGTFALGVNRLSNFNQNFRYSATPRLEQDILQRLSEGQGNILDDLAYEAYLTERDAQGTYIPADYENTGQLTQRETIQRSGGQTQFDFGYANNYRDKIYIGGAIGIVSTRYDVVSTLTATDPAAPSGNPGTAFGSLTLRENTQTRGTGVNARLGVIYRPVDVLRLGASIQSPTYSQVVETYSASLNTTYDSPITVDGSTLSSGDANYPAEDLAYTITSPFRATGGVAVVVGKNGFFSADAEYVNYGQARLGYDDSNSTAVSPDDLGPANDNIRQQYQSTVNLRAGGELRLDIFRVRAGYARYGSPYKVSSSTSTNTRNFYTAGLGLRQNNFFLDVAGVYSSGQQVYTPYELASPQNTPRVSVDDNRFTTTITAGFQF
ncbi:outer membrane protein transport protein [Hymenobacter sp. HSC-4F20]|uniref:OmpP1/FadL family transporter n=1 Tax=Hymenobacter sp. HSC-4F20 TaxID=2864135 RepID=UPI001C73A55A|nr:outer membrane protein transport protein [Hymenobacter sp. HSC-4F20]MBX0292543.1 outer membrane protein transport protein [Hymenobacter sp. HSC-4F20]